tara:strand:+ start:76 stop:240 length:165 start_codon:yes stop_codon:yes gene_type:complete
MNEIAAIAPVAWGLAIKADMDWDPGSANPINARRGRIHIYNILHVDKTNLLVEQ